MKDCYSPLKIFHHQDRITALRHGVNFSPIHVQIILTNRCNQHCGFCAYRTEGYTSNLEFSEREQIPYWKAFGIVEDCADIGVKAIELTGGGEPTIYPKFAEVCGLILKLGMAYGVVTNGSAINGEGLVALSRADWIRFSIDAGSPSTYAETRRSSEYTYSRVLTNIQSLVNTRAISHSPIIGIGFVVTEYNWKEIYDAAKQAKDLGVDNFRISAVFQNEGSSYFADFYDDVKDLCSAAKQLEDEKFTVFNLFGDRVEDLEQQSPSHSFCPIQRFVTYIGADLSVYRCCVLAYNERGRLGSIANRKFSDLWFSTEVRKLFEDFDARQCPRCMFNKKNEVIRYALNQDPGHVNFL